MCFVRKALISLIVLLLVIGVVYGVSKKEDKQVQNNYKTAILNQKVLHDLNIVNSEKEVQNEINKVRNETIEKETRFDRLSQEFLITSYDLSSQSCGKLPSHPQYGVTCSGYSLKGLNWESARVISVDPNIIPLGSQVEIRFNEDSYKKFSGIYVAKDTGSAIKNNHIDLFLEDCGNNVSQEAMNFGKTYAKVMIIK